MADKIASVPVTGTWWRHVPAGAPALHDRLRDGDGRWQRGEAVGALYLAADPPTAWAEWYRALAELAVPPASRLPRDLWRLSVTLERVADLSRRERLAALSLPDPAPDRLQWPTFQAVGERLADAGYEGVLFCSAARPAAHCLCVFRAGEDFRGVRPLESPERVIEPPVPPRGMRT